MIYANAVKQDWLEAKKAWVKRLEEYERLGWHKPTKEANSIIEHINKKLKEVESPNSH